MRGDLVVVGMSHRTAPIELRERLALPASALAAELRGVVDGGCLHEALLVSTCNRVELYAACADAAEGARTSEAYLQRRAAEPLHDVLYRHTGREAVRHAFRVASSLDSLVVGEPQILGQVKDAYEAANAAGAIGNLLGRCFSRAFAVAKRVRSETGIAEGTVSVSSIACELATKIFGDLATRRALLIGAGDMGEAAARSLAQTGAQLVVVNRSLERAEALAGRCGGEARSYETMALELVQADVVITSTASPAFVLTYELLRDVVRARRHRPLFLIDIAVPRDVDPRAAKLEGVFLYDVDDLQKVADENLSARRQHLASAEQIVEAEVADFETWKRTLELTPTIVALRRRFAEVVRSELERALPKVGALSSSERQVLDKMVHATVNKLLHDPLTALKSGAAEPDGALLIAATRRLFRIDEREAAELEEAACANDRAAEAPALELATALGQNGERK